MFIYLFDAYNIYAVLNFDGHIHDSKDLLIHVCCSYFAHFMFGCMRYIIMITNITGIALYVRISTFVYDFFGCGHLRLINLVNITHKLTYTNTTPKLCVRLKF